MESTKEHFRHILLYYFRKGKHQSQVAKKLCDHNGDKAFKEGHCRNWFIKFRSEGFSLKDKPHSCWPSAMDEDDIKDLIDLDCHVTEREMSEKVPREQFAFSN